MRIFAKAELEDGSKGLKFYPDGSLRHLWVDYSDGYSEKVKCDLDSLRFDERELVRIAQDLLNLWVAGNRKDQREEKFRAELAAFHYKARQLKRFCPSTLK